MNRSRVLRADAAFLTVASVFGLIADLLSYSLGTGPFGQTFYANPSVIGVVEAHGLALVTAATMWRSSTEAAATFGNWIGVATHILLGMSNIVWFDVFTRVQAEPQGLAVTAVHFVFVALNVRCLMPRRDARDSRRVMVESAWTGPTRVTNDARKEL